MNANIGMVCPVAATVATYTAGSTITYNTGKVIAEAVSASLNWNRSDGEFYGDDVLLDSDNGVTGYTGVHPGRDGADRRVHRDGRGEPGRRLRLRARDAPDGLRRRGEQQL